MKTGAPGIAPDGGQRAIAASVATLISLATSAAFVFRRPDLSVGAAFLFGDEAANLFVADRLNAGARLYHDVAYPYGPLPIYGYALMAQTAGNTPDTYLASLAVLSALTAGMVAWIVRPLTGCWTTMVVVVLGLIPTVPLPGATIGGYTSSVYLPLERLCLLGAVMLWQPPLRRSRSVSLAAGAVLGACQSIRFGSGVVMLLALVAVDALIAYRFRGTTGRRRPVSVTVWLILGFVAVETALVIYGLVTAPIFLAVEWLWPLQLFETHQTSGAPRWPVWAGWRMMATQYVLPLLAAVLSVAASARWVRQHASPATHTVHTRAVALLAFYVLAAVLYFRHEHHFRQFAWTLVPAAVITLERFSQPLKVFVALLCAPAVWPLISALVAGPSRDTITVKLPRGYTLRVDRETGRRLTFLEEHISRAAGPVLFMPNGAGWLHAHGVGHITRHTWFYSRAVVRPFEERAFAVALDQAAAVVVCEPLRADQGALPVPDAARDALRGRFAAVAAGSGCSVLARASE